MRDGLVRLALVLVFGIGYAAPAHAAISRISAHSAQANSVAITTPTAGDLIIVFSHRDGSTTAPTLATGYTNVASAGANTNAARLAYKYSDGTETTSGTWTNATSVAVGVYRGVDPHYPIGAWAAGGGASTSLSFTGITLWAQDNSSWVAGFAGHRTATNVGTNAPSGMASRSSATDVAIFDTGGTTSTWTTQTASVSANSGWRTYVVELRVKPAQDSAPSPDYLVQHVSGPSVGGGRTLSNIKVTLPNATQAGNCLVLSLLYRPSFTSSVGVADDQSNTWSTAVDGYDATNDWQVRVFTALNIAANTRAITVTLNDTGVGAEQIQVTEFYGIATSSALDGTPTGTVIQNTTPTPIQAGSITTTQANDLIYQVAFSLGNAVSGSQPLLSRIAKDAGLTLLAADLLDGGMAQYGIKASAGATNPAFYTNTTGTAGQDRYVTATIALKTNGANGSAGSGKRIVRTQACNFFRSSGPTINLQFPSTGNLLVFTWLGFDSGGGVGRGLSGVADTFANTWSATGTAVVNDGGESQIFYALSPSVFPNYIGPTLTVASSQVQQESNGLLYDIAYENKTWAFDNDVATTGTQSTDTDLTSVTVTPTGSDGIIIGSGGIDLNTINGMVGAGFVFDAMVYPEADGSRAFYEDNPAGHYMNSDTTARTFVWSQQGASTGVDGWAIRAAAFKAASAGGSPTPKMLLLGVGGACLLPLARRRQRGSTSRS